MAGIVVPLKATTRKYARPKEYNIAKESSDLRQHTCPGHGVKRTFSNNIIMLALEAVIRLC